MCELISYLFYSQNRLLLSVLQNQEVFMKNQSDMQAQLNSQSSSSRPVNAVPKRTANATPIDAIDALARLMNSRKRKLPAGFTITAMPTHLMWWKWYHSSGESATLIPALNTIEGCDFINDLKSKNLLYDAKRVVESLEQEAMTEHFITSVEDLPSMSNANFDLIAAKTLVSLYKSSGKKCQKPYDTMFTSLKNIIKSDNPKRVASRNERL